MLGYRTKGCGGDAAPPVFTTQPVANFRTYSLNVTMQRIAYATSDMTEHHYGEIGLRVHLPSHGDEASGVLYIVWTRRKFPRNPGQITG